MLNASTKTNDDRHKSILHKKVMNKQVCVLVRKPCESMPLIETESSTTALSETKAPGKVQYSPLY